MSLNHTTTQEKNEKPNVLGKINSLSFPVNENGCYQNIPLDDEIRQVNIVLPFNIRETWQWKIQ